VSRLGLRIGQGSPLLLSSTIKQDNSEFLVDLENPDLYDGDQLLVPQGTLHIARSIFLWQGRCHECCEITNYGCSRVEASLTLEFGADFVDIFEVRGTARPRRGDLLPPQVGADQVTIRYRGLDGVLREACFACSPAPAEMAASSMRFQLSIQSKQAVTLYFTVTCSCSGARTSSSYGAARDQASEALHASTLDETEIYTSNEQFNDWVNRSFADLRMMVTDTPDGAYPFAGVPWFSAPFGRDGILTAMEALWVKPSIARGVLSFLAAHQARQVDPERDAEPGKILHERRKGEMAALGEIPFGQYYGSVDATPLFVVLAGRYYQRTADRQFIKTIWPSIQRALGWIDVWGDVDQDGFVEYHRHNERGLMNQGWKDSGDCIFHRDGRLAAGSIALCEVQGYVYEAKKLAATLARAMDEEEKAVELERQARDLSARFERSFWSADLGCYVLALDGEKKPCEVLASNAGHCLFSGIAGSARALQVAKTLLSEDMFSGWGVRTIAASEVSYNPMSYHNGSIWPHDNAVLAAGLSRYGLREEAAKIFTGLFDASLFVDLSRLPELFCGFPRRPREGPTLYPVACAPQSWAAASVFLLLQSCLNLEIDARAHHVSFEHAVLPDWLPEVTIKNLRVGEASLDLRLHRHPDDVGISVLRRSGHVDVVTRK